MFYTEYISCLSSSTAMAYCQSMPLPFSTKHLIPAVGILHLIAIKNVNTASYISTSNHSFTKHPGPQPEDKPEIHRGKPIELEGNTSIAEDEMKKGEFCVKMKPLEAGDKLSTNQMTALGCLFEYVTRPSHPDGIGLLNCFSQAGRNIVRNT